MSQYEESVGGVAYVLNKMGYKVKARWLYHFVLEMNGSGQIWYQDDQYKIHLIELSSKDMEICLSMQRS